MTNSAIQQRTAWGLSCLFFCAVAALGFLGAHSSKSLPVVNVLEVALIDAVKKRDTAAVRELLSRGVNPNARDNTVYAIWEKRKVQENMPTDARPGPVAVAVSPAWPHTFRGPTALMIAAANADTASIEALIQAGADPDATGISYLSSLYPNTADIETYYTPLMEAMMNEKPVSMKLLLKLGADVNAPASDGRTALNLAHNMRPTFPLPRRDKAVDDIMAVLEPAGARGE